jgi:hypothetical protein
MGFLFPPCACHLTVGLGSQANLVEFQKLLPLRGPKSEIWVQSPTITTSPFVHHLFVSPLFLSCNCTYKNILEKKIYYALVDNAL